MKNRENRILGRILAVEETRYVNGAKGENSGTGPGGVSDISLPIDDSGICDDSSSQTDTICEPNSDVVATDPICDFGESTTKYDICMYPA